MITDLHHTIARAHGIDLGRSYTPSQAARLLGIHVATLHRRRAAGLITATQTGKRRYLGYDLVDSLLRARTPCPSTTAQTPAIGSASGISTTLPAPRLHCGYCGGEPAVLAWDACPDCGVCEHPLRLVVTDTVSECLCCSALVRDTAHYHTLPTG